MLLALNMKGTQISNVIKLNHDTFNISISDNQPFIVIAYERRWIRL